MNDRYKNDEFYTGKENEPDYHKISSLEDASLNTEYIQVDQLSPSWGDQKKSEKELIINKWKNVIPKLEKVQKLKIFAAKDQRIFEMFCMLPNLVEFKIYSSKATDLKPLLNLKKLKRLEFESFTRLRDISPLQSLKLTHLRIENCFRIENFSVIGSIPSLIGLSLNGYVEGQKNLRIQSLRPFKNLNNLKHLDLNCSSIVDKESFEVILQLKNLVRFDILVIIPEPIRSKILEEHPNLDSGNVTDWDPQNKKFYDDKNWEF